MERSPPEAHSVRLNSLSPDPRALRLSDRGAYVVGSFDGGLVVIPLTEARQLAALNDALEQSTSWGDFLQRVADDHATQSYLADQYGDELPDEDEPFDADEVPGFADGFWPPFPKEVTLSWIPMAVRQLGTVRGSAFGAEYLHIEEERRSDVIDALRSEGFASVEDTEDLVARACGAWRYS